MKYSKTGLTQNEFLVTQLRGTRRELTVAQARAQFGIGNLRARVAELRAAGLVVSTRKTPTGEAAYMISARDQAGSRRKIAL